MDPIDIEYSDNECYITELNHDHWHEFTNKLPLNNSSLVFLHINIASLSKNFTQIEYLIANSTHVIHVIIITEANIHNTTAELFPLPDYNLHYKLRNKRKGGGIMLYIHKSLQFNLLPVCTNEFECLTGQIIMKNGTCVSLCALYRPPDNNLKSFIVELENLLRRHSLKNNCIVMGDMNLDTKKSNPTITKYLNLLCSLGLDRGITQYTRVEKYGDRVTKSCIDHVLIRIIGNNEAFTTCINIAPADHKITGCAIIGALPSDDSCASSARQLITRIDNRKLRNQLEQTDFEQALNYMDPNKIVNYIKTTFDKVYTNCSYTTVKSNSKRKTCIWSNRKLIYMCGKRDELFKVWQKDPNNANKRLQYNKYRNKTNKYTQTLKNNNTKSEICLNFKNPPKLWQIINRLTGKIVKCIDEVLQKHFKENPLTIANNFGREFISNVKNICTPCNLPLLDPTSYENIPKQTMRLKKASEKRIEKIIKSMNVKKSPGYDGIRVCDIKNASTSMVPVITHLINRCLETSTYPDLLKIGIIRPIHKKGKYNEYNNYRPITILSCIDKIIERYIGDELNKYLYDNNIINSRQFGFQRNKSTTQLLRLFTDEINKYLNNKNHVLAVFIDFSKAFDVLNFNMLFNKLIKCGIQGPLLELIKNYHCNRYTTVKVTNLNGNLMPTDSGTAQGSILGPIEYLLYVNDMSNLITKASVYQFADDTCLLVANRDITAAQTDMQTSYDMLCKWAHDVGLVINAEKTKLVHIHSSHITASTTPIIVSHSHQCLHLATPCVCKPIVNVNKHTYIGLVIDDRFCWKPHIEHVCAKLRSISSKLLVLKYKMPYKVLRLLYMALADSVISYGISSYGRTFATYLHDIYKLQRKMLKIIVPRYIKKRFENDDRGLFGYCRVINVYDRVKFNLLTEENRPECLVMSRRPQNLRQDCDSKSYILPKCNNFYGTRTSDCQIPIFLNELTEEIKKLYTDSNKYKSKLKSYYTEHQPGCCPISN